MKKRSIKAGLAPGTAVHIGTRRAGAPALRAFVLRPEGVEEHASLTLDDATALRDRGVVWLNVDGVHDIDLIERLGVAYGLHPLVREDIANTAQRPKCEDYPDHLFLVLRMILSGEKPAGHEQVSLIMGDRFVLSFQEGIEGDAFEPVRRRLRSAQPHGVMLRADRVLHALMDAIVDGYFRAVEDQETQLDEVESALDDQAGRNPVSQIHRLRHAQLQLRRTLAPTREAISALLRLQSPLLSPDVQPFLRDVYSHCVEVLELTETGRERLASLRDAHLAEMNRRLNEEIKSLTLVATVFMPPTLIAGIYGMNFRHMPELGWVWGYPASLLLMAWVTLAMIWLLRRRRRRRKS